MATPTNLNPGATDLGSANWEDTSGFATAAAQLYIGAGTQNIAAGVDQSGAQVILSLTTSAQYSGNIGSEGSPLYFKATDTSAAEKTSANTEAFFLHRGSGNVALQGGATAGTNSIDNVIHAGSGTMTITAGTFPYVTMVGSGTLRIRAGAVIQNLKVYGGTVIVEGPSGTNMTTVTIWGGSVTLKRPVSVSTALITINGGSLTYAYDSATGTATATITQNGGRFYHNAGPVTTHNHNAGLHDVSGMYRLTTITTCTRTPNSQFTGQRVGGWLTVTNDITKDFPIFSGG